MTETALRVPTIDDARRVAKAVLEAIGTDGGGAEVYLYGSVAREEAHEHSDIDLYVVFANLHYDERYSIKTRLGSIACEEARPISVDLHVSDLPEWEGRIRVTNSFQHDISRDAISLCSTLDRRAVRWGKPQVWPMSEAGEAQRYLGETVVPRLDTAERSLVPSRQEGARVGDPLWGATAEEQNEELEEQRWSEQRRLNRITNLVANCAMSIEVLLKSVAVLQGKHPVSLKEPGHDITNILDQIDEPERSRLRADVTSRGLTEKAIGEWRVQETYPDNLSKLQETADADLYDYLDTMLTVGRQACDLYDRVGLDALGIRRQLANISDQRRAGNIRWRDEIDPEASAQPSAST